MAEVADKALGMVEQASRYMEDQIKKIAPEVWRIMVKQQYGNALGDLIYPFGWMLAAIAAHIFLSTGWKLPTSSSDEKVSRVIVVNLAPTIIGLWAFLMFMYNMSHSVKLLFNPEYYAVRDLMKVILLR